MNQAMGSGDDYHIKDPEEHSGGRHGRAKQGMTAVVPPIPFRAQWQCLPTSLPVSSWSRYPIAVPAPSCARRRSVDSKFLSLDPVFPFPPAPRGRVPCVYLSASFVASFGDWVSQCGPPHRPALPLH